MMPTSTLSARSSARSAYPHPFAPVAGDTLVKYTIQRDGRLTNVEIERSSGYFALDQTAQRALLVTRQLPPLPPQFTESTLTVHLIFRYER